MPAFVIARRLDGVHWAIATFRPRHVGGDLGQAPREVEALLRIYDADGPREPIMMGAASKHHPPTARNVAGVFHQIGPDALVAPIHQHLRAVGVDRPEFLRAPEGLVRVLPASVNNASVVHHRRQVVRLIVGGNEIEIAAIGLAPGQHERARRRHATHVSVPARGAEDDVALVGQIDRIKVVEGPIRELRQPGAVHVDFIEVKRLLVMGLETEQHLPGVPGQIGPPERAVQGSLRHKLRELAVRTQPFKRQEARAGHSHVA